MTPIKEPWESASRLLFVIITWNRKENLRVCLNSLNQYLQRPLDVVVVDNASDDGTSEMVKKQYPDVMLFQNQNNLGFSRAANQGLDYLKEKKLWYDYVVFFNDDAELQDKSLNRLIDYLDQNTDIYAALPSVFSAPGRLQTGVGGYDLNLKTALFYFLGLSICFPLLFKGFFIHQPYFRKKRIIREVDWISGVCLVLRREAAEKLRFSEDFFMYAEDVALGKEIRKYGKIIYFPLAQVFHGKENCGSFRGSSLWLDSLFKYFEQQNQGPSRVRVRFLKFIFILGFLGRSLGYMLLDFFYKKDYRNKKKELLSFSRYLWQRWAE